MAMPQNPGGGDGRKPPAPPAPAKPGASAAARPGPAVPGRPRTFEFDSSPAKPAARAFPSSASGSFDGPPPKPGAVRTQTGSVPRSLTPGAAPRTVSGTGQPQPRPATLPSQISGAHSAEEAQQRLRQSNFDDHDEHSRFGTLSGERSFEDLEGEDDDEATATDQLFDGERPARGVTSRDLIAINAPLQSREGRRSARITTLVIDQFAVGNNPRYEPDAPGKPRAHIFVWDVTRALNVEVPHFFGSRELSLSQTCNWIRQEGPGKGWFKTTLERACEALENGGPVLVMPRDIKIALVAVARPGDLNDDGRPFVTAATLKRGRKLTMVEAFGVSMVDYYMHG